MIKSFKYRLYPTKPQIKDLEKTLFLCRQLYNTALEKRKELYKTHKKSIGYYEQANQLPSLKEERPEYKNVNAQVLQDVLKRVDKAYQGFFRRIKKGETPGYPRFKGEGRYDSFTFPQANVTGIKIQEGKNRVLVHKIGSIKCKFHRPLEGQIKTASIKRENDEWYIIFTCITEPKKLPVNQDAVGIDLGTNPNFLTTSDSEMVPAPRYFKKYEKTLSKAQKIVSKRKPGSNRRNKAKRLVAKIHKKIANQRKDFHHKVAKDLVNKYGTIVHEDLDIKQLAQTRTAKGVLDAGWAQFLAILAYKAEEAGRQVIKVDPKYTSQDCPVCGNREKHPLWIRTYTCAKCNTTLHRDIAAAQNILAKAWTEPSLITRSPIL
jgi:putative transposase